MYTLTICHAHVDWKNSFVRHTKWQLITYVQQRLPGKTPFRSNLCIVSYTTRYNIVSPFLLSVKLPSSTSLLQLLPAFRAARLALTNAPTDSPALACEHLSYLHSCPDTNMPTAWELTPQWMQPTIIQLHLGLSCCSSNAQFVHRTVCYSERSATVTSVGIFCPTLTRQLNNVVCARLD